MATEKFTAESPQQGRVLNGVTMTVEKNPYHRKGMNASLKEPPLVVPPGKHVSTGVVVIEPDGRVWLIQPKNQFGGYRNTFPKGTVQEGEDLQETAIREVHEESGLVVEITGHLADVERTTSVARFYEGRRVGGAPWSTDKHTHAVKLVPIHGQATDRALLDVFGSETTDQQVLNALRQRVAQKPDAGAAEGQGCAIGQGTVKKLCLSVTWLLATGMLMAACSGSSPVSPSSEGSPAPPSSSSPPPPSASSLEDQVLVLVNQRRASGATCGGTAYPAVAPLTLNLQLRDAARGHSQDMATNNYFSHTSLDGRTFDQRIRQAGYAGGFSPRTSPRAPQPHKPSSIAGCRAPVTARTS